MRTFRGHIRDEEFNNDDFNDKYIMAEESYQMPDVN